MEGFIGQIMMFGGNFAIRNWSYCDGQLMAINNNTALFSILGTIYGGDGRTTFALPDLRGRAPINIGNGAGLSNYSIGQKGGQENVTLNVNQLPAHHHDLSGATLTPGSGGKGASRGNAPDGNYLAQSGNVNLYSNTGGSGDIKGIGGNTGNTGANQSFSIRQPYLAVSMLICQFGIFPSRN